MNKTISSKAIELINNNENACAACVDGNDPVMVDGECSLSDRFRSIPLRTLLLGEVTLWLMCSTWTE